MPEGPPKEEMGEGSEGWSDFYGSVRPRYVESDDVRDALWATDEFESDEVRMHMPLLLILQLGQEAACGRATAG